MDRHWVQGTQREGGGDTKMGLRDCSGERTETQREIQREEGEYKTDKEDRDSKIKRVRDLRGRKETDPESGGL